MRARCRHGRPWFAECLGCIDAGLRLERFDVSIVTWWRAMDDYEKKQRAIQLMAAVRKEMLKLESCLFCLRERE